MPKKQRSKGTPSKKQLLKIIEDIDADRHHAKMNKAPAETAKKAVIAPSDRSK